MDLGGSRKVARGKLSVILTLQTVKFVTLQGNISLATLPENYCRQQVNIPAESQAYTGTWHCHRQRQPGVIACRIRDGYSIPGPLEIQQRGTLSWPANAPNCLQLASGHPAARCAGIHHNRALPLCFSAKHRLKSLIPRYLGGSTAKACSDTVARSGNRKRRANHLDAERDDGGYEGLSMLWRIERFAMAGGGSIIGLSRRQ